ncbi:MAG: putative DNA binding domain-containing protein [Candidatus Eisenbacteria bacterium]|nr:putative DNA binding domain-containing protein [Candidatus Eisenbacteria bacterium]
MSSIFSDLLEKLQMGDESVEIEAKPGKAIATSVLQTVSAFSNEPGRGGGYILLGVDEEPDGLFGVSFRVSGVNNPGKLQADLATRCANDMSPPVRPQIDVEAHEDRAVIVAFIPEAPTGDKPVYVKSEGLPGGAYRRIANTDQHCTDDDLSVLYQNRSTTTYDATPVEGTTPDDIEPAAVREYRIRRAEVKPDAGELVFGDTDLLYALGATAIHRGRQCLTIAGLMLFGKEASLRRFFPMVRVDYILVPGREWVPDPESAYSAVEMRGPLVLLIPRVVQQVLSDVPMAFSLAGNSIHRKDIPLVPRAVIREAVVNALMHRSYRHSSPVQIIRYTNRIEIRNPGASLVAEDRLGEPGSFPRNEKIAASLHEIGLAETKGTGIRAMRQAMHQANLTPPLFESDRQRDEFGVMLLVHHLFSQEDIAWLGRFKELNLSDEEARSLAVIREAGAITNAMFRDINGVDSLAASGALRRLRDAGLLGQRGKGRNTYYIPTEHLLGESAPRMSPGSGARDGAQSPGFNPGDMAQPPGFGSQSPGFTSSVGKAATPSTDLPPLPPDLAQAVQSLRKKAEPEAMQQIIHRLCAWHPLRPAELGAILGRNPEYLQKKYLAPMRQRAELEFTKPDPADPQQSYRAVVAEDGQP